jgi:ArsR family metal-binding transcriptional regulator
MTLRDITNSLSLVWAERLPDLPPAMAEEITLIHADAQALADRYEALQTRSTQVLSQIYSSGKWTMSQIRTAHQVSI